MKGRLQKLPALLILLLLAVGTVVVLRVYKTHVREDRRDLAHAKGQTLANIKGIYASLSFLAYAESDIFARSVGTGLVTEATSLPLPILTNFFGNLTLEERIKWELTDAWGHPIHIMLSLLPHDVGKPTGYDLRIWSNGLNHVNEHGDGDDLAFQGIIEPP